MSMAGFLEKLDAERAKLLSEKRRIDGLLDGLEIARRFYLASLSDGAAITSAGPATSKLADGRGRASPVRDAVFAALEQNPSGLSSPEAADAASKILGKPVNRKTASSVLSVASQSGSVVAIDGRYMLPARTASADAQMIPPGEKSDAVGAPDLLDTDSKEKLDATA
jgi:hypothetical protein